MAEGKVKNLLRLSTLRDKYDALTLLIHACLVEKGFRCVGCGEQRNSDEEFDYGETLPPEWNGLNDVYALQYRQGNTGPFYLFKALKLGNMLAVYLMEEDESKMQDTMLNVNEYITNDIDYSTLKENPQILDRSFKQLKELQAKLNNEVLDRFTCSRTASHGSRDDSQTNRTQQRQQPRSVGEDDPLRVSPRRPPDFRDEWIPPTGTFPYGDGDRFPGHPGGGGMVMDPFRSGGGLPPVPGTGPTPGQLPRGSVPPGARFDPFGPVPPGGTRGDTRSGRFPGYESSNYTIHCR
ncbi:hypothetical protein QZH41_011742 [Actinostola sp. cb2023]|nr:hypothetical protein QZH41_011742 [Actinostola sp. cb2023]